VKLFAAVLILLVGTAHAEIIAYLPNPNGEGGLIELSDVGCTDTDGYEAFIVTPGGFVRDTGCWRVDNDLAAVRWDSVPGTMYYRLDSLNLTKPKKQVKPSTML
jgi:hypothetical protein